MRDPDPSSESSEIKKELKERNDAGGCAETWTAAQEFRNQRDTNSSNDTTRRGVLASLGAAGIGITTIKTQVYSLASITSEWRELLLNTQSQRNITIEGADDDDWEEYEFEVSGQIVERSEECEASINDHDTVSDDTVEGMTFGGRDTYVFTGEVTRLDTDDGVSVYIDCEEVDPDSLGKNTQSVTIEGEAQGNSPEYYVFSTSGGEINKSTDCDASINDHDNINGNTVEGLTYDGRDTYEFTGNITRFSANDGVSVYIDCEEVEPDSLGRRDLQYITIEASENNSLENYTFSISGELIGKSAECSASINDHDMIDGNTVEGLTYDGRDTYAFTGDITQFGADDGVSVYINCEEVLPESVGSDIIALGYRDGDDSKNYEFSVSGEVNKCAIVRGADISEGTVEGSIDPGERWTFRYSGGVHTDREIPDAVTTEFRTKATNTSLPDSSEVNATRKGFIESGQFDNSKLTQPLVRIYQADGANISRFRDVADDIKTMFSNCDPIDGYRIEWYETNITGLAECVRRAESENGDPCKPYRKTREYIGPDGMEHHTRGGGNIFIHPCGGGSTFGGANYDNYITMNSYNDDRKAPVSIKTLDKKYSRNGEVYWAAAHEIGHQLLGSNSWWGAPGETEDFGCCSDGVCGHYLSTVKTDNSVTVMSQPGSGHVRCGDCSNQEYDAEYASVETSSCFDQATQDAIRYVRNNLQ